MSRAARLEVRGLSRAFEGVKAVEGAGFHVEPGEIVALVGPSGCGKSTTLRMIAGLETQDEGQISLGGERIEHLAPERRAIGIVFQDYALFPHLTVLRNVAFALADLRRGEREGAALPYLKMVELEDLAGRYPDQLSGGQQQRVALARAFAGRPRLILLDEPFSNLDASLRHATRREVRALLKKSGIGAVLVTHDQEEALSFADRVSVMRAGRIEQTGEPSDLYSRPKNAFVASFLGRTNLVRATVRERMAHTVLGPLPVEGEGEGEVLLSIRPEYLELAEATNGEAGAGLVLEREFKGHDMTCWVGLGGEQYQVDTDFTCPFRPGDAVRLVARAPAVIVAE
ncbi:ABC transporter ATP-binding protein [Aureimonas populi]|uniref:ABC transporter ATP-binding protein n=1 Tax=Aureimonas populi TaxID=1701758 RepID=A0ABW5CJ26_9HYPH|nr:ABC transporter ATP-binding protein [Aureimonas populi]